MGLGCPNCGKDMVTKQLGNVDVDYCQDGCKGVWFDDNELKKIREVPPGVYGFDEIEGKFVPKNKEEALNEEKRFCPRCKTEMYRYNWDMKSNIFLDSCEECHGVFVDNGELDGMREYLVQRASEGMPDETQIQLKLAEIEHQTRAKMDQDKEENIKKVIDWDVWKFDDILRFFVRKFTD